MGWRWFCSAQMVVCVSLPSTQTLFLHPEMEAREKVKGVLVRARQYLSAILWLTLRRRLGVEAGTCRGRGRADTQSGSPHRLGVHWSGKGSSLPITLFIYCVPLLFPIWVSPQGLQEPHGSSPSPSSLSLSPP